MKKKGKNTKFSLVHNKQTTRPENITSYGRQRITYIRLYKVLMMIPSLVIFICLSSSHAFLNGFNYRNNNKDNDSEPPTKFNEEQAPMTHYDLYRRSWVDPDYTIKDDIPFQSLPISKDLYHLEILSNQKALPQTVPSNDCKVPTLFTTEFLKSFKSTVVWTLSGGAAYAREIPAQMNQWKKMNIDNMFVTYKIPSSYT
jgi:hypothetical protein